MKNFKITLSLLIALLLSGGNVLAERVSQSKAIEVASSFMRNSGKPQQHMEILRTSEDIAGIATKTGGEQPKFYVVGNQNGKGFVIVSADDRFYPILGYSLDRPFESEGAIPSNVEKWFSYISDQMDWAEKNNIVDPVATAAWKTSASSNSTGKLLETAEWGQSYPYYNQCPTDASGQCVTGCVATAVAEVMRYYKYPAQGNGTTSTYTASTGYVAAASRTLSKYDWDNMPLTTAEYDTDAEKTAVSTLMADVGAALQLSYSSKATAGNPFKAALVNNFGYESSIENVKKDSYSEENWINLLKNEINNNRPIIYVAYDDFVGGHCFLIDGYNESNYFHVNWGWNGSYNGYYLINVLNVTYQSYSSSHSAILNFQPQKSVSSDPNNWLQLLAPGLSAISLDGKDYISKGMYFQFTYRLTNVSLHDFSGYLSFRVVDKRGNLVETLIPAIVQDNKIYDGTLPYAEFSLSSKYSGIRTKYLKVTKDIKPGYRVRVYYSTDNENYKPLWFDGADTNVSQEILLAEDVDLLEYRCSLKMSNGLITLTIPEGAEAEISGVTEGVTKNPTSLVVDSKKLTVGTAYTFTVTLGDETKTFTFTLNKQ